MCQISSSFKARSCVLSVSPTQKKKIKTKKKRKTRTKTKCFKIYYKFFHFIIFYYYTPDFFARKINLIKNVTEKNIRSER